MAEFYYIPQGDKSKLEKKNRKDALIKFVLSNSKKERQIIRKYYKIYYGKDIYEPLKKISVLILKELF